MGMTETVQKFEEQWQVEVGGQIYEATIEELVQWIGEGALQPADKVRRANLRWLEADKIPALHNHFRNQNNDRSNAEINGNASIFVSQEQIRGKDFDKKSETVSLPVDSQTSNSSDLINSSSAKNYSNHPATSLPMNDLTLASSESCQLHADLEAHFICKACAEKFCQTCPKSFGSVRICPVCGEMCEAVSEARQTQIKTNKYENDVNLGFGFGDFKNALAYPFKYCFSLISGAVLFMFFTLGQGVAALDGTILSVATIFCWMLANTLTFGVLAHTVESFSHGKTSVNFMPAFDDFNLWDDVIQPFFLSLATYVVSFGALIIITLAAIFLAWNTDSSGVQPSNPAQILSNMNSMNNSRPQNITPESMTVESEQQTRDDQAKQFEQLEKQIAQAQEQPSSEETTAAASSPEKMFSGVFEHGKLFLFAGLIALLWGVFYYPAACAVAGYTRSFSATLNPFVGLDTIKRLGFDYAKILFFSLLIFAFVTLLNYILSVIFASFDLPQLGNIPVKAISSLFIFYFSVVFSVTLGLALYKNSNKLNFKSV